MPDPSFWRGRKVFLTGHTGFKGSWLSLWLDALGAVVTGYALAPPTRPNLFEQASVEEVVESIEGNVLDFPRLQAAIAESRPEVIIHLAAQSVVRRSYEDPIETYSTNVMGTVHLFEALRRLRLRCVVINVTSDKCYENKDWPWGYREVDPLGGHDPYSNSKACAELVTSAFRDSYFSTTAHESVNVAVATARAGNVVGGGDWTSDQLIPDLMRAFLDCQPCKIRNPHAIRPWQFVLEPLRGYLMLAERLHSDGERFAAAWNFGPDDRDAKPVSWLADELAHLWGENAKWCKDDRSHPPEAYHLKLDSSKTCTDLDWYPVVPLTMALEWIIEWYHAYQRGNDLRRITRGQIDRYQALAKEPPDKCRGNEHG